MSKQVDLARKVDELQLQLNKLTQENAGLQARLNTHDQLQERLNKHMTALKTANAELSDYDDAISHDLRAPLRAIRNYTTLLRKTLDPATLPDTADLYLTGLSNSAADAGHLVEDLLELSRIGRTKYPPETIKLDQFFSEIIAGIEIPFNTVIELYRDWPKIYGQRTLLRQIVQNLIENSVKFNRADRKCVSISWQLADTPDHCTLVFQDNGIGIDPDFYTQIFRPFHRLHTADEFPGNGIGLAIVKKAVQTLNGSIRLESSLSTGSTFYVTLPTTPTAKTDDV